MGVLWKRAKDHVTTSNNGRYDINAYMYQCIRTDLHTPIVDLT